MSALAGHETAFLASSGPHRMLWDEMALLGKVRWRPARSKKREGEKEWFVDFWPELKGRDRFLWGDHGQRFRNEEHAEGILGAIRGLAAEGMPLEEAVGHYRRPNDRRYRVVELAGRWIADVEAQEGEGYSPYTVRDYKAFVANHFAWWGSQTVSEVSFLTLEDWVGVMRSSGLGGKSIRNVLAAFRGFLRWYRRRRLDYVVPEFPSVKRPRTKKRTMPLVDQVKVLFCIDEPDRGVFLMLAWLAKRQGEGRAILIDDVDWRGRRVWVGRALKGDGSHMVLGGTKTGDEGWYPIPDEVWEWMTANVPTEARFQKQRPLFANPRTGRFYSRKTIQQLWRQGCEDAEEVEHMPPNQALRHSTLSELAPIIGLLGVQSLSGHADLNTLRRHYIETSAATKQAAIDARRDKLQSDLVNETPTRKTDDGQGSSS